MSLDRIARKSFNFLIVGLLGVAVYFQAAGAVELVAADTLRLEPGDATSASSRARRGRRASGKRKRVSGTSILSRNPFDSVTGPLDQKLLDVTLPEDVEQGPGPLDISDPLGAPECAGVTLNIVSESDDAAWSVAQLRAEGDDEAMLRRVGDSVGDKKVAYIGYNAYKASPAVWLVGETSFCQVLLFAADSGKKANKTKKSKKPKSSPPARSSRKKKSRRRGAPKVPPEIAERIQKISETEFNIDRGVIDNILENQAQLMRSARIVPEQKDGKTVGIRLFGIRSDTLLGTLGIQNGDRLEKINGFDMASPEKALEAYARLRTANKLTVQLTRRGKPLTIDFQIK